MGHTDFRAELGAYRFTVTFIDPWTPRDKQQVAEHGGMLIWLGGDEYLIAGSGVTFTVEAADGRGRVGLEQVDEGRFVRGVTRGVYARRGGNRAASRSSSENLRNAAGSRPRTASFRRSTRRRNALRSPSI